MQLIVIAAKIQISLRVLSVESQASFLYYVRGGCRHSSPLSFVCLKAHLMRRHTHKLIIDCSNRKPLNLRTVAPVHSQFLDHEESTKWIWSHRPYGLDRVELYMYKTNDTYSTCKWQRLISACAFDTPLASRHFCYWFCLPETLICGKYDQTRLWSVCASSQLVWYIYLVNLWRRLKDTCVKRK